MSGLGFPRGGRRERLRFYSDQAAWDDTGRFYGSDLASTSSMRACSDHGRASIITGMLTVNFHPDSNKPDLVAAAAEYTRLWQTEGGQIVARLDGVTGLTFAEEFINAIVFEGVSQSHPLCLRASYPAETKKGTLIHELCHRLVRGNRSRLGLPAYRSNEQLQNHQLIDLFLFDVWVDLYGEEFARRQVEVESERQQFYKEAWGWALSMGRGERETKLRAVLSTGSPREGL